MNEIVKKLLLAGDEFMPEIHLKQTKFTYSASELFIKSKERIKKSNDSLIIIIYIPNRIR